MPGISEAVRQQPSPTSAHAVGDAVGADVPAVGTAVGLAVGDAVGEAVGDAVGPAVGDEVGLAVGAAVGSAVGDAVGVAVGVAVGDAVGTAVGVAVGAGVRQVKHSSSRHKSIVATATISSVCNSHLPVLGSYSKARHVACARHCSSQAGLDTADTVV